MKTTSIFSLVVAMCLFSVFSFAQEKKAKGKYDKVKAGFGVTVVQTQPHFPGGNDSLHAFVASNTNYPKKAMSDGVEGRVYVGMVIEKTGKLKDVRLLTSANTDLDAEALRIVQSMPDWVPGTIGGSPVDVQFIIPVDFILPKRPNN